MSESTKAVPGTPADGGAAPEDPVEQLWRLWRKGQPPDVLQLLAQLGDLSAEQVAAVLHVDQRWRWQAGLRIPAETYLAMVPALQADDEGALDLIYGEFLVREELGERPALEEYAQRFPRYADQFRLQVELHRAVDAVSLTGTSGRILPGQQTTPPEGGAAAPYPQAAWPEVAGYEVLGELGRGGMGVVYQARQVSLNRVVALKMIRAGSHADPRELGRFRQEAELEARLQHPNIVQVYEVGVHAGCPYLALEFVDGPSLAQRCAGVPQEPHWAAAVVQTLARAAHEAHRRGVVHRDLKPANVLLTADGTPKVTDFGLAKHLEAGGLQTQSGAILGTPCYMAPEQTTAAGREVGPAIDVYALGAILYEMLAGRPVFQAATVLQTLEMVRSNEPVPPSRLQPRVPRDLETICLKCLRKEPGKRYASAHELAEDLRRFLGHEPIRARRTGSLGRTLRWCRRNPRWAAMLAFTAVLAAATVVVSSAAAWRAHQAERDGRKELFRATFAQAQALRKGGEAGQRCGSLAALEKAVGIARSLGTLDEQRVALRNEAVACLALADLRVVQEWDAPAGWDCPTFDDGLQRYACTDEEGNVRIFQVAGGQEVMRLPGPGAKVDHVQQHFSAGGRFLATAYWFAGPRPPQSVLWELSETGPVRRIGPADHTGFYAFSADGRRLAVPQPDASITLYDLVSGEQRSLGPDHRATTVAFRPDGRQLAFTRHQSLHEVHILDVETNQVVRRLSHPDDVRTLAWSADGRLLAAGCDDRNVHVWDTQGWNEQALLEGHQSYVTAVAFSPAGDLLASAAWDGTTRLWDPVSGRQLVSTPGTLLQFSADGGRLAFQRGGRLGLWEVADGRECRVLHHGRVGNRAPWRNCKGPQMLDFSPDGRLLLSAADDGVRLWDVAGHREVAYLNAGHHEAARFHPDGTLDTFGRTGLRAWPVREDRGPGTLRVGPAQLLATREGQGWFRGCVSADGSLVAAADHVDDRSDRVFVFPADRPGERILLGDGLKVSTLAVSPDGHWVAASVHEGELGVHLWDARTGRPEPFLPEEHQAVTFSPDGRWLVGVGPAGCHLWKVGSWEAGPALTWERRVWWAGPAGFRPDGRVLAVSRSLQQIQLVDGATLQEVATLTAPDPACVWWPCFSPDGRLLAVATESHGVHLWDLGAIGAHLRALGLGCDLLPDGPAGPAAGAPLVARVFQEVYEAEHLPVVASADCTPRVQDMKPWGRENWSNGKVLFCPTFPKGWVELQVDVPETGRYTLAVRFTHARDFGVVEVALDGQKTGPGFDGYGEQVAPSAPVRLGTFELREGSHRLRFTAADKNPKAGAHHMGIDCVQLTPADGAPGAAPDAP
jgi:eukaryotic-like serine/threonine-protein kinase